MAAYTQGEIRVGPSHQARLPECDKKSDDGIVREELRWSPAVALDGDLVMYLRAARSMAAFAGMCDGGSADDGRIAASRDDTTINALDMLHDSGYDPDKALLALVKCPVPKSIDKKWGEDEIKRFVKGLRQFGKNFFRIRKDLLPHKDTPELVEFYYLWKKTPLANNNRPYRRRPRQGSLRRIRGTRNSPRAGTPKEDSTNSGVSGSSRPSPSANEKGDGSSGSDDEDEGEDDSDSRENGPFRCQHCFSANCRDLEPLIAKERLLVCAECRAYYKKYGELPPAPTPPQDGSNTPYLFRPVGSPKTRKNKDTPTKNNGVRPKRGSDTNSSDIDSKCANASPSSPNTKKKAKESGTPSKTRKRDAEEDEGSGSAVKRKREGGGSESPVESLTTADSGSVSDMEESEAATPALPQNKTEDPTDEEDSCNISLQTMATPSDYEEPKEDSTPAKEEPPTEKPPESENPEVLVEPPVSPVDSSTKLSVKKEGLFDSTEQGDSSNAGTDEVLAVEVSGPPTSFLPSSPAPGAPPMDQSSAVKIEPVSEESSSVPERPMEVVEEVAREPVPTSPSYPPPPAEPTPPTEKPPSQPSPSQPILMPSYPIDPDKPTLNIPSVPPPQQFTSFYHPHFSASKMSSPTYLTAIQSEPQNLKIKQEEPDPLQSLKEFKVPGYSPTSISQPLLPTTTASNSPHSPFVESIKKEQPEYRVSSTPPKSPAVRGTDSAAAATPPAGPAMPGSSGSPAFVLPRLPSHPPGPHFGAPQVGPIMGPSSFPLLPFHYPFPYFLGFNPLYQIPPPVPTRHDPKMDVMAQQQTASVSSRKESDDPSQEVTMVTHHQLSSSTTMRHPHHADKQTTLSHHSSSTTQHKINKRSSASPAHQQSPHTPTQGSSSMHSLMSQTTSLSTSHGPMHHYQHMHSHMASGGSPTSSSVPQSPLLMPGVRKSHHSSIPTNSLEALRAHAQAAAGYQQSPISGSGEVKMIEDEDEPEESPSPSYPGVPSPEPKIEDSECHRSQSAIFIRHWNRGEYNSCCRTDLMFKPVPESKLARKREERVRKAAEKDREERERRKSVPEKPEKLPPSAEPAYDRLRPGFSEMPLVRMREYESSASAGAAAAAAAAAASGRVGGGGFSPVGAPGRCIDPAMSLHYSLYGARPEHLDHLDKRDLHRDMRDRDMSDRMKEEMLKAVAAAGLPGRGLGSLDSHWFDPRRYQGLAAAVSHHFYPPGPAPPPAFPQVDRDRLGAPSGYGRPGTMLPGRDGLPMHHPPDLLSRPMADSAYHQQLAAHEQMQTRQFMERSDRELRTLEELMRQHRDMKVRAFEEIARSSRP